MSNSEECKVVAKVRADLLRRSELGIVKYGQTLHTNPERNNPRYWLQHAYEEALDLANYLQSEIMRVDGEMPIPFYDNVDKIMKEFFSELVELEEDVVIAVYRIKTQEEYRFFREQYRLSPFEK